ncbi:MAG: serine hydrolase, partial [Bacteroidota bacterium]
QYEAEAGTRWSYHNAPYTLLDEVLESATGENRNQLTRKYLHETIGMDGVWFQTGFNVPYFSTARSMARFGLLIQQKGSWNGTQLFGDQEYFQAMTTPSQDLNEAYGYLWWLNAGETHRLPRTQFLFPSRLIPSAPAEVFAALGKNDQKIYVWPSEELVFIRMGDSAEESALAASSFDSQLWEKIMDLSCE